MYIKPTRAKAVEYQIDFRKSPEYVASLNAIVRKEFNEIKNRLINTFSRHPVTVEIEAGINTTNTSGTLAGRGNLFSFIGFEPSDRPTAPIHEMLKDITIASTVVRKNGMSNTTILHPTPEDIFAVTPLPWAQGRSWARGIEEGISNLGQYLYTEAKSSRSGKGIQSKNQVSGSSFSKTSYISKMIKDFQKEISTLNKIII
tara:strand:+ start:36102 stop:36704 length:603 start_codon:yes stop_codon:yes gene_type:complete